MVTFKIATRVALALNIHKQDYQSMPKQNILGSNEKLFIILLIKNRGGNTFDNLETFMKIIVFITFLNKHRVDNTADGLEKLMKVTLIHTFHLNYPNGMKLF